MGSMSTISYLNKSINSDITIIGQLEKCLINKKGTNEEMSQHV